MTTLAVGHLARSQCLPLVPHLSKTAINATPASIAAYSTLPPTFPVLEHKQVEHHPDQGNEL